MCELHFSSGFIGHFCGGSNPLLVNLRSSILFSLIYYAFVCLFSECMSAETLNSSDEHIVQYSVSADMNYFDWLCRRFCYLQIIFISNN